MPGSTATTPLWVSPADSAVSFVLVPLADGQERQVHGQWLRERCSCSDCVAPGSLQPFVCLANPMISPKSLRVTSASITSDSIHLQAVFADGHHVTIPMARLAAEVADFRRSGALVAPLDASVPPRNLWDASSCPLAIYQHADLLLHTDRPTETARRARRALLASLMADGLVVVKGVPCHSGEVLRASRALVGQVRETHWGIVFDVQTRAQAKDDMGNADQAFSSSAIGFHADNTYRRPMIDYQLLHCLTWEGREERPGEGVNLFVDAVACAEKLRIADPTAFSLLTTTPVKWENDAPMISLEPMIQLANDQTVSRVFFSAKSGGFAPLLPTAEEQQAFYDAQRSFTALLESEDNIVRHWLEPGDLVMFANTRVLHARTAFSDSVTRHLQGLYLDHDAIYRTYHELGQPLSLSSPTWTNLIECPASDVDLMAKLYAEDQRTNRVQRVLGLLTAQRGTETQLGASVDLYQHGLQTATRAHRAGEPIDVVVGGLLHDVGELFSPSNHGDFAAALLEPYIDPAVHWCLAHHEIFQLQFYGPQMGVEGDTHLRYAKEPHYELTQRFCRLYDQAAFDADYEHLPLSFFTPMVEEVFGRPAFWHTPTHPKRGLVTGDKA